MGKILIKNCFNCKKEFKHLWKGFGNPNHKRFCSHKCSTSYRQKTHREELNKKALEWRKKNIIKARKQGKEWQQKWRDNHREEYRERCRKRIKSGEIVSDDNILFYGYKEPLRKFEGGFGYQGVLSYSKDKDKVQCHLCGRMFRFLNNGHLGKIHGITSSEYKEKVGLSPQASLVGEGTREKLFLRPHNPKHMKELKNIWKNRKNIIKKTGKDPQSHPKQRLEIKNRKGTCPDQLLDMIDKTTKSFGRVPTQEEFVKFHYGKYLGSIRNTFGTWTEALAKLNLKTNHKEYTPEYLITEVKEFYKVHRRTPRWSDWKRGLLPNIGSYYTHFRGLNHVRALAGVPVVIQYTGRRSEEVMPDEKMRMQLINK
jgi:hypothetical protein